MKIETIERGGQKFSFSNREEFEAIYADTYERNEYSYNSGVQNPFIIDCGSHIGVTVLYFKKKYPNARIIAFEPNPHSFELLKKNVEQNDLQDVTLWNKAVFDREGAIDFYIDKSEENAWGWGDSAVKNRWYSEEKNKTISVASVKLSSYINEKVDLLKLDVEGAETVVLREIENKLPLIDQLMMEFHGSSTNPDNTIEEILEILQRQRFFYKINQEWKYIPKEKIKKPDPFWLTVHAVKKK